MPTLVSCDKTTYLKQLLADGLCSDNPRSSLIDSDSEEEPLDFNRSEIGDPDYEPSDNETSSGKSSFVGQLYTQY